MTKQKELLERTYKEIKEYNMYSVNIIEVTDNLNNSIILNGKKEVLTLLDQLLQEDQSLISGEKDYIITITPRR
jgi:hypothetical protein